MNGAQAPGATGTRMELSDRTARLLADPVAPLRTLLEPADLAGHLTAAGLAPHVAEGHARRLARCAQALLHAGVPPDRAACALVVPGRIEVLGKHTDYAGGRGLLAAVEQGIALVAAPRPDARVRIHDLGYATHAAFDLSPDLHTEPGDWTNYAMTVARRLARDFGSVRRGADVAFESDLPPAAGVSSSSALIVALGITLGAVNGIAREDAIRRLVVRDEDLAGYFAAVESGAPFRGLGGDRGVGTEGGSEDHTAILCARPGHVVQYAFLPTRLERIVPLPAGHVFAVGVSGVHAAKTGSALELYNRASRQARRIAELWRGATGRDDATIGAALEAEPGAAERLRAIIAAADHGAAPADALLARLDQFIAETREIIPAAAAALAAGDLAAFGRAVDRSQMLAERALGNQVDETVFLARSARELGAAAASAFGAGFGGSVWALVEEADAARFLDAWRQAYLGRFPVRAADARFFTTRAGPPAVRVV
jgi:galactokinase